MTRTEDPRGFRVADRDETARLLDQLAAGLHADRDEVVYSARTALAAISRLVAEGAREVFPAAPCSRGDHEAWVLAWV